MPQKKIVQDIIPSKRRSIREVTLDDEPLKKNPRSEVKRAERGIRVPVHLDHSSKNESMGSRPPSQPAKAVREKKKAKKAGRKWLMGVIVLVCMLVISYAASIFLARATVVIVPRSETVPVEGTFTASKNAQSPNLPFETVSTTTEAIVNVDAVTMGGAATYATGMATLVNLSSPSSQEVAVGTRLVDDRGLVYKTASTVIIPATTSKSSGMVLVKIIASAVGPAYDSTLASQKAGLSIVAWQGTPKAKIFYAKMTTSITGGSSGPLVTVATTTLGNAVAALSSNLSLAAPQALQNLVPSGYILYPNAENILLSSTTISSTGSTTADISMSATATGILFNENDLENVLAKDEIAQFPADNYQVNGLASLAFAPLAGQKLFFASSSIKFTLSGTLDIVGVIDGGAVKNQLEGKALSDSNSVFSQYNSVISSARVSIVPFWIRTIPSSPKRISVVISTSTDSIGEK